MRDFEFDPASVVVTAGAEVALRNLDGQPHTATSVAPGFDTGNIEPGSSGTFVAPNTPGSYAFYCVHHAAIGQSGGYEGMVGVLEVQGQPDAGASSTPAPGAAFVLVALLLLAILRSRARG